MALERTIDALVVGAGPVGLAAALGLVRSGHRRVEIIDEASRRTGLSYALALHPATLEVLERLGVAAALIERGNRVERIALYDGAVRRAELALRTLERAHPYVLVLSQAELEEVLLAALAAEGVGVRWSHRLRHLEAAGAGAAACTIDRIDADSSGYAVAKVGGVVGRSFEREVPLVIGADGHASLVRRQLGIERQATAAPGVVAVFELDGEAAPAELLEDEVRNEMRLTLVGGLRSAWWPLPGGRTRLGFELPAEEVPTAARGKSRLPAIVPWLSTALDEARLHELVAERIPWHATPVGRLMWSVAVRFERSLVGSFGRGRVWLAGDAAHLAFPFGVLSMNEGIAEAEELASRGGRMLAGEEPWSALEAYGSERLARWRSLLATPPPEVSAGPRAGDPWLADNARAIVEALPVSPAEASSLVGQQG